MGATASNWQPIYNYKMNIITEAKTEDIVPETGFNLDFLQNEEQDGLNDFDHEDWDLNLNNQYQDVSTSKDKIKGNQIDAKIRTHKYNEISEQSNFPSFSEIQKSLQVVRRAFPQTFTDKVIDSLFSNLMEKMNNPSKKTPSQIIDTTTALGPNQRRQLAKNANKTTPSLKIKKSDVAFRCQTPRRASRVIQRNLIPGIQQIPLPINRFAKIQLPNPQKGIAQRLDKIWTEQFQVLLLNLYRKGHQFSLIRDHFQQEYPQYRQYFTVNSLRGRFYKVIRQTVRKLYVSIEKLGRQNFPRMMRLDYSTIQNIMYFQQGRELRCLFIDLYFAQRINQNLIDRIIAALHKFIIQTKAMADKKNRAN